MLTYIQKRFAMSEQGAKDFMKGVWWTTLQNFSFMLPVILVYLFLHHFLASYLSWKEPAASSLWWYIAFSIAGIAIIYVVARRQYENTYVNVYKCHTSHLSCRETAEIAAFLFREQKPVGSYLHYHARCHRPRTYLLACRATIGGIFRHALINDDRACFS